MAARSCAASGAMARREGKGKMGITYMKCLNLPRSGNASMFVLLLFWVTSRPAYALVMLAKPPAVVGLFVNPADSSQAVVKLRLPGHFSYCPGEVIAFESTD